MKRVLLLFIFMIIVFPSSLFAGQDVQGAIVKIYAVHNRPDYRTPWNMKGPQTVYGSGSVIDGERILTNAHIVSDQTFIQVRLFGQSKKYTARVLAVSHDADLALLTVDKPGFFDQIEPLVFGQLPQTQEEVLVYGFPLGGDTLSSTKGVISRIEHHTYVHSGQELLAGQIDAAINPGNSGGPVMADDRIVGVVMQTMTNASGIGYMVPVNIIEHFLDDFADGSYDGFPTDGIRVQSLVNDSLKKMKGLSEGEDGVLVLAVQPCSPARGKLKPGDVILAVDGHKLDAEGRVEFRPRERTSGNYYIEQRQLGETISLEILRNGRRSVVEIVLDRQLGDCQLYRKQSFDEKPSYYIYGGLVFTRLSANYLKSWGSRWTTSAPFNLIGFAVSDPELPGEEVVIIQKVLPAEINKGYEELQNRRIVEVNGRPIRNLKELVDFVETGAEEFVVFTDQFDNQIVLERQKVKEEQERILSLYQVSSDRSDDLK